MRICIFGIVVALAVVHGAWASTDVTARVMSDRVNLRAKPDMESEMVVQAGTDDRLTVRGVEEKWVQVVPPAATDVWVHKDFLKEDRVVVNRLNARSGAGINYTVVGHFTEGDQVERRGSFGEWVKVAPPVNASLWVSRDLVELVYPAPDLPPPVFAPAAQDFMQLESTTAPLAASEPVVAPSDFVDNPVRSPNEITSATPATAPTDLKIIPLDGQGRETVREGQLKRSPSLLFKAPGSHRLVRREGNKLITTAYLRGNVNQLEGLLDEYLVIRGKEYWIEKTRVPVIVIEAIEKRSFY
jgi:SH3-like domain-containing protein